LLGCPVFVPDVVWTVWSMAKLRGDETAADTRTKKRHRGRSENKPMVVIVVEIIG
jgi:hypothetical protein